jgi:hypothetical protein
MTLGLLAAGLAMWPTPLDRLPVSPVNDALNHSDFIASAAGALAEGQWLLREVPRVRDDETFHRYALFQFYSVVPYTMGGLLVLAGMTPYRAMAALVGLSFALGFWGVFVLARSRGAGTAAALAGALAYTFAPYHLADWYARYAFPELVALGLLPWVLWAGLRAGDTRRLRDAAFSALAWALLIHTHHVFHAWALFFFCAYALWRAVADKTGPKPLAWMAASYALGLACSAAFFAPAVLVGGKFLVGKIYLPFEQAALNPLKVLLSPVYTAVAQVREESPGLALQVGWPILAAALVEAAARGRRAAREAALACWILSFLVVWSPLDFWRFTGSLASVQFPYRLLAFNMLFGSLLAAAAWQRLRPGLAWKLLLPCGLVLAAWFTWPHARVPLLEISPATQQALHARGGMPLRTNLLVRYGFQIYPEWLSAAYPELRLGPPGPRKKRFWDDGVTTDSLAQKPRGVRLQWGRLTRLDLAGQASRTLVTLPALWYPGLYRVWVDGQPHAWGREGAWLAVLLEEGQHTVEFRMAGLAWANALSLAAWAVLLMMLLGRFPGLNPAPGGPRSR